MMATSPPPCLTSTSAATSVTEPITLVSFTRREDAAAFANELGRALKLPARDYVGTEPDADDDPQS